MGRLFTRRMRAAKLLILVWCVTLSGSCATVKTIGHSVQQVVKGETVDQQEFEREMKQSVTSDTKEIGADLQKLRRKFEEALTRLRANVQKRWGQKETRVPERTVYVKYTHGYQNRVVTDFDHGFLTVETLDDKDPQASLKTAIVAALLTSNDPAAVDLFSDKDVRLDASRQPYLYGLVLDNQGKPVRTREEAQRFAAFLVPQKVQTRSIHSDEGGKTARFVRLAMVKNFEAKGAERYRASVTRYSAQYQVSPSLVLAIIRAESNFNPFAVSSAPAYGLMQLVPTSGGRAAYRRVKGVDQTPTSEYLFDPENNIELGTAFLSVLDSSDFHTVNNQSSRDYCVIAAYNTGAHNVTRTFAKDQREALNTINGMAPSSLYERLRTSLPYEETRQYLIKVTGYRKQFVDAASAAPKGATP